MSSLVVFPRISPGVAEVRLREFSELSLEVVRWRTSHIDLAHATWRPTGNHVPVAGLEKFQSQVRELADRHGFPEEYAQKRNASDQKSIVTGFDEDLVDLMSDVLADMTPAEAGQLGVWLYLTAYVTPDVALWRWPFEQSSDADRRSGNDRLLKIRRNLFRDAWRQSYLLTGAIVRQLDKDARVGITERPTLFNDQDIVQHYGKELVDGLRNRGVVADRDFSRDAAKRMFRVNGVIELGALTDQGRLQAVHDCVSGVSTARPETAASGLDHFTSQLDAADIEIQKYLRFAVPGQSQIAQIALAVREHMQAFSSNTNAQQSGQNCLRALDRWNTLTEEGRRIAVAASIYYLDATDHTPDGSADGFTDDVLVSKVALDALRFTVAG